MATLKDHQQAMVDLLASGSGIPASASRLAHAMHDVLNLLVQTGNGGAKDIDIEYAIHALRESTTPGLNDKALSKREKALKTDSPAKWPAPAEQRIKELQNTIRQLKGHNAELKTAKQTAEARVYGLEEQLKETEQLWRNAERAYINKSALLKQEQATIKELQAQLAALPEQAGCRKEDTKIWCSECMEAHEPPKC